MNYPKTSRTGILLPTVNVLCFNEPKKSSTKRRQRLRHTIDGSLVAIRVTRLGNLLDFGEVLKPLARINLPKSKTFLGGNFCKVVKVYPFSSEIIFGQHIKTFGDFFWSHWWQNPPTSLCPFKPAKNVNTS